MDTWTGLRSGLLRLPPSPQAITAGSRYSLAHGHTLDGRPITRSIAEIGALIEARARALEVPLLARFNALDDPEGD